jgi:hypothetical protein
MFYFKYLSFRTSLPSTNSGEHIIENLGVINLIKKIFNPFGVGGSLLYTEEVAPGLYPEPDKSNPPSHILFL